MLPFVCTCVQFLCSLQSGTKFGICLKAAKKNQGALQEDFESWATLAFLVLGSQVVVVVLYKSGERSGAFFIYAFDCVLLFSQNCTKQREFHLKL